MVRRTLLVGVILLLVMGVGTSALGSKQEDLTNCWGSRSDLAQFKACCEKLGGTWYQYGGDEKTAMITCIFPDEDPASPILTVTPDFRSSLVGAYVEVQPPIEVAIAFAGRMLFVGQLEYSISLP